MPAFSQIYKPYFRKILKPLGFIERGRFFFRDFSDELGFIISASKQSRSCLYQVAFCALPYCAPIREEIESVSDLEDWLQFDFLDIMRRTSLKDCNIEELQEYVRSTLCIDPVYPEITAKNIERLCADLQSTVLPFLHGMSDLEAYYSESVPSIWNEHCEDYLMMSLKLHKFEPALKCVDTQISDEKNLLSSYDSAVSVLNSRIEQLSKLRGLVLNNDTVALDAFISDAEKENRAYLRKLLRV